MDVLSNANDLRSCIIIDTEFIPIQETNGMYVKGLYTIKIINRCNRRIILDEVENAIPPNFEYYRVDNGSVVIGNNISFSQVNTIEVNNSFRINIRGTLLNRTQIKHEIIAKVKIDIDDEPISIPHSFLFPGISIAERIDIDKFKKYFNLQLDVSNTELIEGDIMTSTFVIEVIESPRDIKIVEIQDAILPFAKQITIHGPFERIGDTIKINQIIEKKNNTTLRIFVAFQVQFPIVYQYSPTLIFEVENTRGRIPFRSIEIRVHKKEENNNKLNT